MRVSLPKAGWLGFGLAVGMAAVSGAGENPKILVTHFSNLNRSSPNAAGVETRLVETFERAAEGLAHVALQAGGPASGVLEADDVRALAASSKADYVLVGSWLPGGKAPVAGEATEAAIELHSGHSGATEHRYRLHWSSDANAAQAADAEFERLALAMLEDLRLGGSGEAPAPVAAAPDAVRSAAGKQRGKRTDFLTVSRDQPIEINSDKLEVFAEGRTKHLIFSDSVRIVQGDMQLFAGYLEAFYPDGASQPDRLNASKTVRVVEGDLEVRCLEATYLREDGLVICRGNALLVQGCDEVRGQAIEFYIDEERVKVVGAASVVLRLDEDDTSACSLEGTG